MLLKDKVAVITGGAGPNGLGFATAKLMAQHGARVAVLDLAGAEPAAAAAKLGDGHLGLVADVTDKASCDAAIAAVLKAFGRIDMLVNNAGITQPRKTVDITDADYDARARRQPARHLADVAGRASDDAAPAAAARSSASRRSRRSAAAASSAARTTRRPRPACSAWPARWRASWASTASASTASPPGLIADRHQQGQAHAKSARPRSPKTSRSAASA